MGSERGWMSFLTCLLALLCLLACLCACVRACVSERVSERAWREVRHGPKMHSSVLHEMYCLPGARIEDITDSLPKLFRPTYQDFLSKQVPIKSFLKVTSLKTIDSQAVSFKLPKPGKPFHLVLSVVKAHLVPTRCL